MVIRSVQIDTLSEAMTGTFESDLEKHLRRCFPKECALLGPEAVRKRIRYGIDSSRRYGIVTEREVCMYVDLMIVFGPDFDRDPNLPWASSILNAKRWKDTSAKMDRLYRTAKEHLQQRSSDRT